MAPKTVLITGCSEGGIGDALAKCFHRQGLRVFATARNLAKIEHLKKLGLDTLSLDVTDSTSIKEAVDSVSLKTGGKLDFLVNNSGAGYAMPLLDSEVLVAQKMFDINVFALVAVTQAFSPLLIFSKGTVINIGSIAGISPGYWQGYYNASKAAVNLITDQLRLELEPLGVKAILVITGGVKTKFFDNQPSVKLPDNSPYAPARDMVETAAAGHIILSTAVDVDVYANKVVKNALKKHPQTHQLAGGDAWAVWFLSTFFWHTIWDLLLPSRWSIPELKKKLLATKRG
ncbi:putative short-chain dehydrogenase protein [Botrytis fragariae]|uniref:Putative short-chain dehydrogenase protein n=1 Tax=Botrytis fragariae TaxID=1964551 RepID=A0A8H6EHT9_9HELO|nr:putative short-chain dehydrogenase protein [Botrytis fragariae]KAF5872415.1 putative short-chain dehydrogenase protein [Botrytis fragariae]